MPDDDVALFLTLPAFFVLRWTLRRVSLPRLNLRHHDHLARREHGLHQRLAEDEVERVIGSREAGDAPLARVLRHARFDQPGATEFAQEGVAAEQEHRRERLTLREPLD